ncbi:MAG: hypothetical protein EOP84_35790, partial [Verrucomicrobiaceae bacterium]
MRSKVILQSFYVTSCLATKMVTVEDDLYEGVMAFRRAEAESFSEALRRALPDNAIDVPALELLHRNEEDGGILMTTPEQLDEIERFHEETNVSRQAGSLRGKVHV